MRQLLHKFGLHHWTGGVWHYSFISSWWTGRKCNICGISEDDYNWKGHLPMEKL